MWDTEVRHLNPFISGIFVPPINYDKMTKSFIIESKYGANHFGFIAAVSAEYTQVTDICIVYHLKQNLHLLQSLEPLQYVKQVIALPGYELLRFQCYFLKKGAKRIAIFIPNPYEGVRIEGGQKGTFKMKKRG